MLATLNTNETLSLNNETMKSVMQDEFILYDYYSLEITSILDLSNYVNLVNILEKMPHLKRLDLSNKCAVNKKLFSNILIEILKVVEKMENLEYFGLSRYDLETTVLYNIYESLSKLPNLKEINLTRSIPSSIKYKFTIPGSKSLGLEGLIEMKHKGILKV